MPNNDESNKKKYIFVGFDNPNTTPVPDVLFDELMTQISDAELRVLLYIIRRTFGFKKDDDTISLKQMVEGIRRKDGRVLDQGTGLSKSAVARGLKGLIEKGIIVHQRNSSPEKGNLPTTYALRDRGAPMSSMETGGVSSKETRGVSPAGQALVLQRDTQETVKQETVNDNSNNRRVKTPSNSQDSQDRSPTRTRSRSNDESAPTAEEPKKTAPTGFSSAARLIKSRHRLTSRRPQPVSDDDARLALHQYVEDYARQFNDQAELPKSISRAVNLYRRSGLGLDPFIYEMRQAARTTQEYSAKIKSTVPDDGNAFWGPKKNKMGYFFSVLEDRLGLKDTNHRTQQRA